MDEVVSMVTFQDKILVVTRAGKLYELTLDTGHLHAFSFQLIGDLPLHQLQPLA